MNCPICGGKCLSKDTHKIVDHIKRNRVCEECGYKFPTIEVDEDYFEKFKILLAYNVLTAIEQS